VLILLVTSPRVAPGQLTLQAWDALRGAARVLAPPGHPQHAALVAAGIDVDLWSIPGVELAPRLAEAAATAGPRDVVWLTAPPAHPGGLDGENALRAELEASGVPAEVLRGSADLPGGRLLDLVATMTILREQCPWDAKQTHSSLAPHLLEEPYEALEALENDDHRAFAEELGDVLLQVMFHAEIASERDDGTGYTIDDVADGIVAKLVRRHPHVFADVSVAGAEDVAANWDEIKKAERAAKGATEPARVSALDGVPFGQPGLSLASQLQRRAARAGLPDHLLTAPAAPSASATPASATPASAAPGGPADPAAVVAPAATDATAPAAPAPTSVTQVTAEADEADEAIRAGSDLGDQLFALVATARAADLDPELELRAAARRFAERVRAWEQAHPA
jgi:NTP pyrophosphatase (non-canonical NTP hydrolase)